MKAVSIVIVLALASMGCASKFPKWDLAVGKASVSKEEGVRSEGFSEGGVSVIVESVKTVGRLAEAALRLPFSILQGAANGAAAPVQSALGPEE